MKHLLSRIIMADKKKEGEPEGEEEFSVEKVLDRRIRNGKVKW